jgi:hypothetical protein
MSALDLIMENPLIIVSMGIGTAILLAAALLLVVGLVRPRLAARGRQRALEREAQRLALDEAADADDELEDTVPAPPSSWGRDQTRVVSLSTGQVASDVPVEIEDADDTEELEEDVSEEMKDMLSSVFVEESEDHRYTVLLQDQEIPTLDELAALSNKIAARLALAKSPTRRTSL